MSVKGTIDLIKDFQNLLFSSILDIQLIQTKIQELKNFLSIKAIDHQIILAFSLNYEKIPLLSSFLSEPKIEEDEFIHFDQDFLFHLAKNDISFPFSVIYRKHSAKVILEKYLYEEFNKQNKLDLCIGSIELREKSKIEEIIDKDDIENFRIISNDIYFHFNGTIKKENEQYKYTEIPIILYCIEKNAMKCLKYALINGADPSKKSLYKQFLEKYNEYKEKEKWNGYGFAGATGNFQIIRMLQDQKMNINENLIQGCSKFHQNNILKWIEKEQKSLLKDGIKNCIKFQNYEGFYIISQNCDILNLTYKNEEKLIHYGAQYNSKEISELLIAKGADIKEKNIFYQIIG